MERQHQSGYSPTQLETNDASLQDGTPWVVLPKYKLLTSRGVPLPRPRAILETEYPDNPAIVGALSRLRLRPDAPRRPLTSEEMGKYMEGWDAEWCANKHESGEDDSGHPVNLRNNSHALSGVVSASAPITEPESTGPSIAEPLSGSSPSCKTDSCAPDVLIMTPIEGPDGDAADTFDNGSMTFALAAAPAPPTRTTFSQPSPSLPSPNTSHRSRGSNNNSLSPTADSTAVDIIAALEEAATRRGHITDTYPSLLTNTVLEKSNLFHASPPSLATPSFNDTSEIESHDQEADHNTSASDSDSEEELEALLLKFREEIDNDDNMSTTSSVDTITQNTVDLRATAQAAVNLAICEQTGHRNVVERPYHRPSASTKPSVSDTTEEDCRETLHCEADQSVGISLHRSPIRCPMRKTTTAAPKAEADCPYNLGPSCSWAPDFARDRLEATTPLPPV